MKRLFITSTIVFSLMVLLGFSLNIANAEDIEYKVTSYIVNVQMVPVPDVEKHAVGMYERRGVAIFKDGETAAYHTRGTFDFVDANGPFQGYSTLTFEDGSTSTMKYSGTMTKESGKLPSYKGKGEYINGTGKYEGIKGNLTWEGNYVTPYNKETKGDVIVNAKGTYTLPK
jgi:hypothetical protein